MRCLKQDPRPAEGNAVLASIGILTTEPDTLPVPPPEHGKSMYLVVVPIW